MSYHIAVLVTETLDGLQIKQKEKYIDATLGGGTHTGRILDLGGRVLGIDQDQDALDEVREKSQAPNSKFQIDKELVLAKGNFAHIDEMAKEKGFEEVSGILFDLGISSHQIDTGERGFSFQQDAVLDMRMDKSGAVLAKDLVNVLRKEELMMLFEKFGEEYQAKKIAEGIIQERRIAPIETTFELVAVIARSMGLNPETLNPKLRAAISKKVFQALRIAVNDELQSVETALPKALALVKRGGRIAVITFHSLEDRIVKNMFKEFEKKGEAKLITKKPIIPGTVEQAENPRSRSAKLRIIEKI